MIRPFITIIIKPLMVMKVIEFNHSTMTFNHDILPVEGHRTINSFQGIKVLLASWAIIEIGTHIRKRKTNRWATSFSNPQKAAKTI